MSEPPPPWRVIEQPDGSVRPAAQDPNAPPWEHIADHVEPEFPAEPEERDRDEEPARRLLAAARRAQHQHQKEDEVVVLAPEEDPHTVVPLARWEGGGDEGQRLVRLRNYAAVDAEAGGYGLIDRGVRETGIRSLVMHTPSRRKQGRAGQPLLDVRPGMLLSVRSPLRGTTARLRVLYTTPARYYSPGQRVTTLSIGVDARDWQAFVETPATDRRSRD